MYSQDIRSDANKKVYWEGTDSLARYNANIISRNFEMRDYIDVVIEYNTNSFGFRTKEFNSDNSNTIMALGCSQTKGVGLSVEQAWPYKLAEKLNTDFINLGISGASQDEIFRIAYEYIPKLKPKHVFLLGTYDTRLEVFVDDIPHKFLASQSKKSMRMGISKHIAETFYDTVWLTSDNNYKNNYIKNTLAIKQIATENNIPITTIDISDIVQEDNARDLMHFGPKTHTYISKLFLQKMEII